MKKRQLIIAHQLITIIVCILLSILIPELKTLNERRSPNCHMNQCDTQLTQIVGVLLHMNKKKKKIRTPTKLELFLTN